MSYINIIADDKDLIVYRKNLRELCKSVTATILFSQLLYWFKRTKNQPFYKFIQPCNQNEYKQGDSWTEELGFSYLEFTSAFSQIGKKYNSKTEMKSDEKINDYMFYAYTDKIERKTYYHINLKLIENNLSNLYNSEIKNDISPKVGNLGNLNSRDEETLITEIGKPKSDYITENISENITENTTNIIKNIKKEKTLNQSSKISTNLEIHLEALENYKQELLANPDKSLFISNRRSEGQIWAVDKAKAQITTICETIKEWLPTRVKKLTSNPKISLRFSQFAEGKELGWIYPEKTNSYQSNDWRDRRTKYETPDELKGY